MPADTALMEKLTALCKRRGFIYQSSEIYGGIGGFWDYGPLGVELKRNIKDRWWHDMVTNPPTGPDGKGIEMVGVDCSIIMNPKVWEASGHATGFADLMTECSDCKKRFRADKLWLVAFSEDTEDTLARLETFAEAVDARMPGDYDSTEMRQLHERALTPNILITIEGDSPDEAASIELSKNQLRHFKQPRRNVVSFLEGRRWWRTIPCPAKECGGALGEPRQFNLMLHTYPGAVQDEANKAYLRPETAQGIFANFKNVLDTTRVKVPFGIAQVGKAFRNEINPRNYTFRSREFEQMEIEFFCKGNQATRQPGNQGEITDAEWYEFWRKVRFDWYVNLGLKSEKLRLRDQGSDELAHYSKCCADIEYLFPFSDEFQELEGVAHRGNYDLTQHEQHSGKDLTYFDDEAWERDRLARASSPQGPWSKEEEKEIKTKPPYRYLPTVIEPSAGVDRSALAFLCEAYTEDEAPDDKGKMQKRVVMRFHPRLAPIKVAVFPLVNRETMPDIAEAIYRDVKKHMTAFHDAKGAIGRRYRRQDEVGTPFCVTVDGQTLEDGTVTIRDRDTLAQIRVSKDQVVQWLRERDEFRIKN